MATSDNLSPLQTVNPTNGEVIAEHEAHTDAQIDQILGRVDSAAASWRSVPLGERAAMLRSAASGLRDESDALAEQMAREMGKPVAQGRAEVEKCAWVCEFYADNGAEMLADIARSSDHRQAHTVFTPMGTVLAVMPWNFPLWQVYRFAAPALMAGNTAVLKHASNVSGSALSIEANFAGAGLPEDVFRTLLLGSDRVANIIDDPRVAAVTLTGSEPAGRAVAEVAGRNLKPSVLELGGSDPYVVLSDADVQLAATICSESRLTNSGQSCIAAKRFIIVEDVYDEFRAAFLAALGDAVLGDPLAEATTVGPQARVDLRDELHDQVTRTVDAGGSVVLGGELPDGPGAFYPVTAIENVRPGMAAFDEELFGPVAPLITASDEADAIRLANHTTFGLGGAVFTRDEERGRNIAAYELQAGCCFVNAKVASDPRLPFGGIGRSGYGRELSEMGIRSFANAKTVVVA